MGFLRICIPTYNRPEQLAAVLQDIADTINPEQSVSVLVSDDLGSPSTSDMIFNQMIPIFDNVGVDLKYIKNTRCHGFAWNFLNILINNDSEYFILGNDDDYLDMQSLSIVMDYIKNNRDIGFISPYSVVNGEVIRGKKSSEAVLPRDFLIASSRSTGLIFKTKTATKYLDDFVRLLSLSNNFVFYYPQSYFLLRLLSDNIPCSFSATQIDVFGHNLPSDIKNKKSRLFYSFESRVQQCADLITLIDASGLNYKNEFLFSIRDVYSKKIAISDLSYTESKKLFYFMLKAYSRFVAFYHAPSWLKKIYRSITRSLTKH